MKKREGDNGSLAQLVEQLTFNQLVAGSNPARPTISFPRRKASLRLLFKVITNSNYRGRLAQLGEHLPYKEGVTGSSPVSPTTL